MAYAQTLHWQTYRGDGSLAPGLFSASSVVFSVTGAPTKPPCPQGEIHRCHKHNRVSGKTTVLQLCHICYEGK